MDHYGVPDVPAFQLVPDLENWTLDVPDLSRPYSPHAEPVWQWLEAPWPYSVPRGSQVASGKFSAHADFMNGWDQVELDRLVKERSLRR